MVIYPNSCFSFWSVHILNVSPFVILYKFLRPSHACYSKKGCSSWIDFKIWFSWVFAQKLSLCLENIKLIVFKFSDIFVGARLLSLTRYHAPRCKASQCNDRPWAAKASSNWLGSCRILSSRERVQCTSCFKVCSFIQFHWLYRILKHFILWKILVWYSTAV